MPEETKLLSSFDGVTDSEESQCDPELGTDSFEWQSPRTGLRWKYLKYVLYFVGAVVAATLFGVLLRSGVRQKLLSDNSIEVLPKPKGFPIIAIVFYGRREYTDVLDCYLRRNLVSNGGYLDEVRFMVHTKNEDDVAWINDLAANVTEYRSVPAKGNWGKIYSEQMTDASAMYIKIDDDVVYVADDAIPRIVNSLVKHPEAYAMSAYIINNAKTNWLAYRTGAIHPYLPENNTLGDNITDTWRPSLLPEYPSNATIPDHYNNSAPPDFQNHRWLPLARTTANMQRTPMRESSWGTFGTAWGSWAMAAQQHYSFFKNLEDGTLDRYQVGSPGEGIWDMACERYSINFMAIWGSTVAAAEISWDDETDITIKIPAKLNRPFLVDSKALIGHYAYGMQVKSLRSTDVLDRYRALANEVACPADVQKTYFVDDIR